MDALSMVHHDDESLRLVSVGGLLLVHMRERFRMRESLAIHAAQETMRATVGRHAVIVVISGMRVELNERTRGGVRRTMDEFADTVTAVAHVIEPRGVLGAAIRCVMAGMRAVHRPPYPAREFASCRTAAMWLAPMLNDANIELPFAPEWTGLLEWVTAARGPNAPTPASDPATT